MSKKDFSYSKRNRLLNSSQFNRVFDQATKKSSEFFTILSRENSENKPRIGIIVAKRHVKRSTDRNLIKRIIKESFRLNKASLPCYDFIVILKRPVQINNHSAFKQNIRMQMENIWKQYEHIN